MTGRKIEVRVVSVETDFKASDYKQGQLAKIVFRVWTPLVQWDLPVMVPRDEHGDDDLIPVARGHLHRMLRELGEQTQE